MPTDDHHIVMKKIGVAKVSAPPAASGVLRVRKPTGPCKQLALVPLPPPYPQVSGLAGMDEHIIPHP
jgi:hypothetical protein